MSKNEIILFNDGDLKLEVPVTPDKDTVWLTLDQMALLFEKDRSVVGKHVRSVFRDGELDEDTSGQILPGSIGAIYQTFGGEELYPTLEEKRLNCYTFLPRIIHFQMETKELQQQYFYTFWIKTKH